ncbi:MAG: hypothetical protein EP332_00985 [Bacteroidetes bacterium]|nr:MAG: hypothetical protein EP332_00985 [Bacteroidota bacterium]
MKQILIAILVLVAISSCQGPKEKPLLSSEAMQLRLDSLSEGKGTWILVATPGTCWNCTAYYYFLGRDVTKNPNAHLILLTNKIRKATANEMYQGLNLKFNERIRHVKDPELFQSLKASRPEHESLVYYENGQYQSFPIDDRDAMDELWPEVAGMIAGKK